MIGTSDQSCWLAEACKILLLLLYVYLLFKPMHACLVADLCRVHVRLPECDVCILGCQTVQCPCLVASVRGAPAWLPDCAVHAWLPAKYGGLAIL